MSRPQPEGLPRVALFGATGSVGSRVLARLLARGCDARLLVRFAEHVDYDLRVRLAGDAVVEGDDRDADAVLRALAGVEVVVSTIGTSDIGEADAMLTDSVRTIVGTMPAAGAARIVAVLLAAVLPNARGGYLADDLDLRADQYHAEPMREGVSEHVRTYEALREAPVAWTVFCPMALRDGVPPGRTRTALDALPGGSDVTGLDDLADAIVAEVLEPRFVGHRVGIVSLPL